MSTNTNDDLFGVYEPLTDEQKAKVEELYQAVQGITVPRSYTESLNICKTLFMAKFLVARKWVVADALEMYKGAAAFRLERKFEEEPMFPCAVAVRGFDENELMQFQGMGKRPPGPLDKCAELLKSCGSAAWHKTDKKGRLVYYERTGQTRTHEMVARLKTLVGPGKPHADPAVNLHLHSNEVGGVLMRYRNQTTTPDKWTWQITAVVDLNGLGMKNLYGPAMDVLKANSHFDQGFYPEGVNRCYCVNSSKIVTAFWAVIRLWLDARVQKKVVFVKPQDTAKTLLEVVDAENLPAFLGGSCKCPNECVPELAPIEEGALAGTVEMTIKAGKTETREVAVAKGEQVVYEVAVTKNDFGFKVGFQAADGGPVQTVRDCGKLNSFTDGEFAPPIDGKVIFTFDNSHSWMKSKTVQFRTTVDKVMEGAAEAGGEEGEEAQ